MRSPTPRRFHQAPRQTQGSWRGIIANKCSGHINLHPIPLAPLCPDNRIFPAFFYSFWNILMLQILKILTHYQIPFDGFQYLLPLCFECVIFSILPISPPRRHRNQKRPQPTTQQQAQQNSPVSFDNKPDCKVLSLDWLSSHNREEPWSPEIGGHTASTRCGQQCAF